MFGMKTHKNDANCRQSRNPRIRRFGSSSSTWLGSPLTFGHEGVLQHLGGVDVSYPNLSNMYDI